MPEEMPQHTTRVTTVKHVAITLPTQPSPAEDQVRLCLGINDYVMAPAAFRQFVACLATADKEFFEKGTR